MRTFGGFRSQDRHLFGEVVGDEVRALAQSFWIDIKPTGEVLKLGDLVVDLPVAPSKLIAVGLNYADHIAEMKRTPLGAPLIWFKAPSSLLAHKGKIEIAFPEHQTDSRSSSRLSSARSRKMFPPSAPSILFLVIRSASISAIAICRKRKNNLAAANRSTRTRRSGRSFTQMSTQAICRLRLGKMASSSKRRAPAR